MSRAFRSVRFCVFVCAGVLGSSALACSPTRDPEGATAEECAQYRSCGACTPILGCGWCDHADGTSICSNEPSVCSGNGRWTWEPTATADSLGCPVHNAPPEDATPDTPSDDAPKVDAPPTVQALSGSVRILAQWTDDTKSGAAPLSSLEIASYGSSVGATTNASGAFTLADVPRGTSRVWIEVLDPSAADAEAIAGVAPSSSSVVVTAFPSSLVDDGAKHFAGAGTGDAVLLVRVVDSGGQPLSGAHLAPIAGAGTAVYDSGIDLAAGDATGPRGIIGVFGVPAGSALVRIDRGGKVATVDAPTASGAVTSFDLAL